MFLKKAPKDIHAGKMLLMHCITPKAFISLVSHEGSGGAAEMAWGCVASGAVELLLVVSLFSVCLHLRTAASS